MRCSRISVGAKSWASCAATLRQSRYKTRGAEKFEAQQHAFETRQQLVVRFRSVRSRSPIPNREREIARPLSSVVIVSSSPRCLFRLGIKKNRPSRRKCLTSTAGCHAGLEPVSASGRKDQLFATTRGTGASALSWSLMFWICAACSLSADCSCTTVASSFWTLQSCLAIWLLCSATLRSCALTFCKPVVRASICFCWRPIDRFLFL